MSRLFWPSVGWTGRHRRSSLTYFDHQIRMETTDQKPNETELTLIDRRELAKRWRTSISTVKRLEKKKLINPVQLGPRLLRFRLTDILAYENR